MMAPDRLPTVSIVLPCRNEARFIKRCLDSILATDYPKDRLEVLVVDGSSTDGTVDIVQAFVRHAGIVRILSNPRRTTPVAMNIGIAAAKGEIIIRMDAHGYFPPEYVTTLVKWLLESGADNVGGVWRTEPADDSPTAKAIAKCLTMRVGVGGSHYRIGTAQPRWV